MIDGARVGAGIVQYQCFRQIGDALLGTLYALVVLGDVL